MRIFFSAVLILLWCSSPACATNYTTYHFDNARDGWNNRETTLTQSNVPALTKIGDYPLDGEVDAQPLFLDRDYIPARHTTESIVYVATENDTVYAVSPLRGLIWRRNFGVPVGANYAGNCRATAPGIGIQGTPVIDRSRDTLYLVAYTLKNGKPAYTLHAVSPATGADKLSLDISRDVGDTYVHRQRAGLLESNGTIYVSFAGFCDHHPATTYGRMLAYAASNLKRTGDFVTTASPLCADFHMGTIWALGFAPAADARGNIYVSTGNGCIDYARFPDGGYADAVLRLTPRPELDGKQSALFAPCEAYRENFHDQEMGAGGVLLMPDGTFAIAGGKTGVTYVLDRRDLGGFHTPCPDRVAFEQTTNWGIWGGPAAWKSGSHEYVVIPGTGPNGVREYEVDSASGKLTLRSQTGVFLRNGGESAAITSDANGTPKTAILWVLTRPTTGVMYLQAYAASDLRRRLLSVPAGSWGNSGGYAGVSPTVVDGYAFVATNKELTIWSASGSPPIYAIGIAQITLLSLGLLIAAASLMYAAVRRTRAQ